MLFKSVGDALLFTTILAACCAAGYFVGCIGGKIWNKRRRGDVSHCFSKCKQEKRPAPNKRYNGVVIRLPDGREFFAKYKRALPEFDGVVCNVFDKSTIISGATLEIWENSRTGEISFGWHGGKRQTDGD